MKVLYLDESGDHNLEKVDPKYPVFVLGGIIVDRTYARTVMRAKVDQLKKDFFGTTDIVLHTTDIARSRKGFEELANPAFRREFYEALNVLMTELEYSVVACVIDKPALVAKYGIHAENPYHYSLNVLIERFCRDLGPCTDGGIIYAEKRAPDLDFELGMAWEALRRSPTGTAFINGSVIDQRICELVMQDKRLNINGLQLADLVVSPIARQASGLTVRQDWNIVASKFRRSAKGKIQGYGLVMLPT